MFCKFDLMFQLFFFQIFINFDTSNEVTSINCLHLIDIEPSEFHVTLLY